MTPLSFRVHTFGCKVNTYDSGLIQSRLVAGGFTVDAEPQVHILNTCAVTREATREAVKLARRLKVRNPLSLVVVTGCAAQVDSEEFTHVRGVDLVVANSHKTSLDNLIRRYYAGELKERLHKSNIFKKEDLEPGGGVEAGHTRSFLKIQDGCDSFCTFCVIPFARGKSRSLAVADLVRRVQDLSRAGVQEVVLTGVHIGDYVDGPRRLEDLVEALLLKTDIPRFRLSSLEPVEVTARLLGLYQDSRLCPHFHMSIQSANSKVLKEMKRQYGAEQVEFALERIAATLKTNFVGMDVIAGFPGETDEEFMDSVARLRRLPWTRLHVFPYSARPGTFAARSLEQVPADQIRRRAEILRNLSDQRLSHSAEAQIGRQKQALVLRNGQLLTRDYWTVELSAGRNALPVNHEIWVQITQVGARGLVGKPLDAQPSLS